MSYIIGSFNIRDFNLSNKSSDGEEIKRDFNLIADIIIKEKFDVVAIQEVNSPTAIKYLTNILNKFNNPWREWESDFSGKAATANGDPEGYGFIWNTKRLRLRQFPYKNNPSFYQYAGAGTKSGESGMGKKVGLIRLPYYGRFTSRGKPGGSNFELRIVNTHLISSSSEKKETDIGSAEKLNRIDELNILIKQVLPRICDHQELSEDGETMTAYTFLMGDYNLELNRSERAIYKIDRVITTNYTGKYRDFVTVQEEKTSLSTPSGQVSTDDCYANNFDHFTYECDLGIKLMLTPQRVEALTKYFEGLTPNEQLSEYRKKISDHVPIKLIVDLK